MTITKKKSILLWIFAFLFTMGLSFYQYKTGPTKPLTSKVKINEEIIKNRLIRSYGDDDDARIRLKVNDEEIFGYMKYKRYTSNDKWNEISLKREGKYLIAYIPHQPPAGKVEYQVFLEKDNIRVPLTEFPIKIRFKGSVPAYILIPHILFMFLTMLISNRIIMEIIFKGRNTYNFTRVTLIVFFLGGLILGPIVQKYAFGAFWTGWPFGHDLTDNKTIVAFLFWVVAFFRLKKDQSKTGWALVASIVLLAIYLIPHSMFGSELDHSAGQ
ncbi:MAG: hypothetical protein KAT48_13940 [Bacteroidales bacterium]|nr:hypothetical protein [Bacteroidales bacterium]